MLGKRCFACGIYIKFFQREKHERWHAEQVISITKLLCAHCFAEHGKKHVPCETPVSVCRCVCHQVGAE